MMLSIIIPAHNEEKFVEETLRKVFDLKIPFPKEVIVINDGSTDNTGEILRSLKGKYDFKLLEHPTNLGKGAAIKTGLENVSGELLIIQDADLEYDPVNIPALLETMNDSISAVYGVRSAKVWPERGFHFVLGAKLLTLAVNILFRTNLHDVYTGYKLFNLKKFDINMLKNLQGSGFEFEAEVTCRILQAKGRIGEAPISYTPRGKKDGKHIKLHDAWKGLLTIFKSRF